MRASRSIRALTLTVLAATLVGCGSESATTTRESAAAPSPGGAPAAKQKEPTPPQREKRASPSKQSPSPPAPKEPAHFNPPSHHDSGGGSQQFRTTGGDNSIQEYGSESSSAEFAAAAKVLHEFLDARAAGAWRVACEKLAPALREQLVQQLGSGGGASACARMFAGLTAGLPAAGRREAAIADVGSLRVEGNRGFLLFHGAHGQGFFIPMVREDGEWKVAAIAASPAL
jgi:hypothetical protein